VICPTHVNYRKHRNPPRAKDADRLWPKGTQPDASTGSLEHTDTKAAGVEVGTKSFVSFKRNKVSPLPRPFGGRALPRGTLPGQRVEDAGKANAAL